MCGAEELMWVRVTLAYAMNCVIIALFLESFSWSGIGLMERNRSLGLDLFSWGLQPLPMFFHVFLGLGPFLLFSWIGTYAPFPSGTIQPQSFPVKTHKFE